MPKVKGNRVSKRKNRQRGPAVFQDDKIYFEGKVVETFPSAVFGVEVVRKNNLPPLSIKASLKTALKVRRVMVIKGDLVRVEINPEDMSSEEGILKGVIVERFNVERQNIPPRK